VLLQELGLFEMLVFFWTWIMWQIASTSENPASHL